MPRVDLKDGSEPTIADLLNDPETKLRDVTGNGNDITTNTAAIPIDVKN